MPATHHELFLAAAVVMSCAAPVQAADAYVDRSLSFTQGSTVGAGVAVPARGSPDLAHALDPNGGPVVVSPDIILDAPTPGRFVSVGVDQQAAYAFVNLIATEGLTLYTVGDGADEEAQVFGRLASADPWTLIGTVNEPGIAPGEVQPLGTFLSLAGTGLGGVRQVLVFGLDNGGGYPGYDLMGIQGNGVVAVPEPASPALMSAGLALLAWALVRRRRPSASRQRQEKLALASSGPALLETCEACQGRSLGRLSRDAELRPSAHGRLVVPG